MPGQPKSQISFQSASSYLCDSDASRTFDSGERLASISRAVSLIAPCSSLKPKSMWG